MKITIEKKPVNSKGQRFLMLTRHYGTTTTEEGKVQKIRKRDALNLFVYANPKTSAETQHNKKINVLTDQILAEKIASIAKDRYHFEQQDLLQSNFFDLMDQMITDRCVFRGHPDTHFGMIRPIVSVSSGHPFRCDPDSRFGVIRPPISVC
ncbi:MAG: hypothetical protein E6Q75_00050, partial [Rheinheimera sp.]